MIWSFPNSRCLLSRVLTEFALCIIHYYSFPHGASGKESAGQCRRCKSPEFDPWVRKIPWRKKWQPTPVFLLGKIPWTEESGRLQSMVLQRVRHHFVAKPPPPLLLIYWPFSHLLMLLIYTFMSKETCWASLPKHFHLSLSSHLSQTPNNFCARIYKIWCLKIEKSGVCTRRTRSLTTR